jgi:potassium/chloride transporter 9
MGRGYAYGDDADAMDREVGRLAVKPNGHKPTQPEMSIPKPGLGPRPVGGRQKLGTFAGVFVPTSLNVLSILMFLRFGFILGQGGVVGMIGMLVAAYLIDLVTTFSLSAIATNGTVRGGGAYYLISRSLGPEFGGSIGVVFYLGLVFNTALNAVGLIDCLKQNFGSLTGSWYTILPEEEWWPYLWATLVLVVCTGICLAGSALFARASIGLLLVLLVATISIPFSALIMPPFESRGAKLEYTGLSVRTFMGNFWPQLTAGAEGSRLHGTETFQDLFGVLFPATSGIFAGASMSGDLKHPSKAIPKGTLYGLALTFVLYVLVILSMAATTTRASLYRNANVIQETNISGILILAGETASTFFSCLMGVIGSAKLLQALARDKLLPGLSVFGKGREKDDEPIRAIFLTYAVAQVVMLADINEIASFITMTYLMTFLVMNLATFFLKIGSAPNFRPSFQFFSWQTAFAGTIVSGAAMFFVDGLYATACVAVLMVIFLLIHYTSPPRSWGDVSQSLIYHQVRKYLLRLRQDHVKFWRPQILLLVNDPRRQSKLIHFCNSLKKGALYILGHVIVSPDFADTVPEARRQQANWNKFIDFSKIKAFVNIAIAPGFEWGARNLVLNAGLGGMRPNIAVLGFYNMDDMRDSKPLIDIPDCRSVATEGGPSEGTSQLPGDTFRPEKMMSIKSYVTVLEDLLLGLRINVAVAKGFEDLTFPEHKDKNGNSKNYIDLWPIQMSAEIASEEAANANLLTTNFDTYTLILQLGCILHTVPSWKKFYTLRVAVFVEYELDVEEEGRRVKELLQKLRIRAEVLVFWLASGDLPTYDVIINGQSPGVDVENEVEECLGHEEWWRELQKIRGKRGNTSGVEDLAEASNGVKSASTWQHASDQTGPRSERVDIGLRRLLDRPMRRHTMSGLTKLGVSLGMRTQRLPDEVMRRHAANDSATEDSGSSDEDDLDSDAFESDDDNAKRTAEENLSKGDVEGSDTARGSHVLSPATIVRRRSYQDDTAPPITLGERPGTVLDTNIQETFPAPVDGPVTPQRAQPGGSSLRPSLLRNASTRKFSSKPVPITRVATEDGPGRSIMFSDASSPTRGSPTRASRIPSAYRSRNDLTSRSDGLPEGVLGNPSPRVPSPLRRRGSSYSTQGLPLSFNDLPPRGQHLILNELIRQNSADTAVIFTTLPAPVAGTSKSEEASMAYLSDLEVLCKDVPPCLLIHSNSMTVTMSL